MRYLYTKMHLSGMVSEGKRRFLCSRSLGRMSSLKLEYISFGISFKMNLSCPHLRPHD